MKSFRKYVNEKLRIAPKVKPKKSTFKGVEPDSKGWRKGKVAVGIGTYTSDGTTINLQKGTTLHYHAHGDKYIGSTNPKDPGTYFRMDKNRVNESTENPEYDPDLGEMNIGEAKSKDIVKGLGDSDGPFTVVAIRNKKVIKQETTKMRNMLPAIVKTMRKDIGPGGTIAIEDKKGTIRGTFKEEVEQIDEWWSKQANPQSKGWKSATVKMNFKSFNAAGEGPNLYKKGTKLFYHPVKLGKGDPVVVATPDVKSKGKYFSVHPDRLGLKGFVSATGTLKDSVELDELDTKTMKSYVHKASGQVRSDLSTGKHSPKTNKRARGVAKAKTDLDMRKIAGKDYRKRMGEEVEEVEEAKAVTFTVTPDYEFDGAKPSNYRKIKTLKIKVDARTMSGGEEEVEEYISDEISDTTGWLHNGFTTKPDISKVTESVELDEKFEMEFPDKETAQKFMSQIVRLRLGSATGTKDGKVTVHGPQQAGVGSPTKAHQQMSKIMKKFGGKIISTDEGPRMKKVFESPKVKIKLDPKKKIGYEIKSVGPGGKTTVTKRRDMPGKKDVGEAKRVYGPGPDPRIKKLSKESKAELAIMANSFGHSGGPHLDANNVTGLTKKAVDLCIKSADKAIKNMGPKIPADFKKMRVKNLAKLKKELGTK